MLLALAAHSKNWKSSIIVLWFSPEVNKHFVLPIIVLSRTPIQFPYFRGSCSLCHLSLKLWSDKVI